MTQPLFLAIELDGEGAHPAAWRAATHPPRDLLDPARRVGIVQEAERAGFHIATFTDSGSVPGAFPNVTARIDAVLQAAFAAPQTTSIGLVPVVSAAYREPFHVATQLASLDYASQGRAGWIVRVDPDAAEARSLGQEPIDDPDVLRLDANDVVDVSRRLWDSWEDEAVIRDVATGRYLDRSRVHSVDFVGETFSVAGPSIVPRPIQGQVVVFGRVGHTDPALLDVALISGNSVEAIRIGAAEARSAGVPRVFVDVESALDAAGESAVRRLAALDVHTVRPPTARYRFAGSSSELVDLVKPLSDVVDGIRFHPTVIDVDLPELAHLVLPALRDSGQIVGTTVGATLRETLRLPAPVNRYAPPASLTQERSRA